jgi:hypothetical protein
VDAHGGIRGTVRRTASPFVVNEALVPLLRFPIGKNRLKAGCAADSFSRLPAANGVHLARMEKRREGGFPDFERGSWAAKYEP